mmetsp:Transcript_67796/g.191931  ORF Transcript_67796/g.191931 Transcript_67796/m.191931 type:complete len:95 (-) Transcript_67796:387-671(-)
MPCTPPEDMALVVNIRFALPLLKLYDSPSPGELPERGIKWAAKAQPDLAIGLVELVYDRTVESASSESARDRGRSSPLFTRLYRAACVPKAARP